MGNDSLTPIPEYVFKELKEIFYFKIKNIKKVII